MIGDIHMEDEKLYILGQGPVEVRDIETGELVGFDYGLESGAVHSVVTDNAIYTARQEKVQRRDKNLSTTWTFRAPTRVTAVPRVGPESSDATSDGKLVVPSQSGLQCLNKNTGALLWEHQIIGNIKENIGDVSITAGTVWASDDQGFLYVLDSESGEVYFEEQIIDLSYVGAGLEASESTVYL
jgi:outer membrane protein assembly factor BamB